MVMSAATLPEYDCIWCRSTVTCLCAILVPMPEAAMSSFARCPDYYVWVIANPFRFDSVILRILVALSEKS